jgi:hypothetical protein
MDHAVSTHKGKKYSTSSTWDETQTLRVDK